MTTSSSVQQPTEEECKPQYEDNYTANDSDEATVPLDPADCAGQEVLASLKAPTIELRKDLLSGSTTYAMVNAENEILKNEDAADDGAAVQQAESVAYHQLSGACYATLTNMQPNMADHEGFNSSEVSNVMTNIMNYCSAPCWMPPHDDASHYSSAHLQNAYHYPTNVDYVQSGCTMVEDAYKSQVNVEHNAFYHLDTSNRRFWMPEPSSSTMDDPTSSAARRSNAVSAEVFMASEFENEDLFRQHAVSIERYPNRCWRGGNSTRNQHEKGNS